MTIELSRRQLITLLECVHAGAHLLNGNRPGQETESHQIEDLEMNLLAQALGHNLDEAVTISDGRAELKDEIIEKIHVLVDDFLDDDFWVRLTDELAIRDLEQSKNFKKIQNTDSDIFEQAFKALAENYTHEFNEHGLEHLMVNHPLTVADESAKF